MRGLLSGNYSKFFVALAAAIEAGVQAAAPHYAGAVTVAIGALLVALVPNVKPPAS
jgi:hypothetical protein